MKTSTKMVLFTIVLAVPAFLLGKVLWPDALDAVQPSAAQLPFFIFLSAREALAFGAGVAFIVFGWSMLKNAMFPDTRGAKWTFTSIAWLLVSWWPHDNMHRENGLNLGGLLRIEYTFHLTLIIASCIIAYNFWKFLKRGEAKP